MTSDTASAVVQKWTVIQMARYISSECVSNIIYKHRQGLQNMGAILMLDGIDKEVQKVSAADVQLVKHGRWISEFYNDVSDVYQADCSVCEQESTNRYVKVSEGYEFCPHCGARMDGDAEGNVAKQSTEMNKPDGNCLDCKFQYLEGSDYWCSICPGNPEDI